MFDEVNGTISGLRTRRVGENEDFDVTGVRGEGEGEEIGYLVNYSLQVRGGSGQIWNTRCVRAKDGEEKRAKVSSPIRS